jgi:LPXTG-site transpeptidase (sortase) family protein
MIRKAVSGLGRSLVTSGVILLLFVVYQLWGTGINTQRDQAALSKELGVGGFDSVPADVLAGRPILVDTTLADVTVPETLPETLPDTLPLPDVTGPVTTTAESPVPTAAPSSPDPTTPVQPTITKPKFGKALISRNRQKAVPLKSGEGIGQLVIPKIHVDKVIVQGTSVEALKKGPGHYKTTPFPGELGNAAIACHRTTYEGPCFRLDELKAGDPIFVARKDAKGKAQWFRYDVYEKLYVKPSNNSVLLPQGDRNTLTMTTCHPQYSAKQRLVVHAELVGEAQESELFDVQDPLAAEYQAQIDARNAPGTTRAAAVPVATTAVVAPEVAPTTAPSVASTTVDLDPSTIAETPPSASADTSLPAVLAGELDPDQTAAAAPKPPTFDGERATGKLHKFLFFTGTAAAWLNSLAWALICGAIWLAAWLVASKRKALLVRWGTYGACFVLLFLPALYFCFENVSRLLPEAV